VPDRVKPSFVIFDIRALWHSKCLGVKNYKWQLNPVWHRMLYSCTRMATVGVKGITRRRVPRPVLGSVWTRPEYREKQRTAASRSMLSSRFCICSTVSCQRVSSSCRSTWARRNSLAVLFNSSYRRRQHCRIASSSPWQRQQQQQQTLDSSIKQHHGCHRHLHHLHISVLPISQSFINLTSRYTRPGGCRVSCGRPG